MSEQKLVTFQTPTRSDEGWVAQQDRYDRMLAPFGQRLLRAAVLRPGETVIDVGCGTGAVTVAAALQVGGAGRVVGVDVAPDALAAARRRAGAAGAGVELVCADAASYPFAAGGADVLLSRFGTMHFEQPLAAHANLVRALRPGGRLVAVVWAEEPANAWSSLPAAVLAAHLPGAPDHHRSRIGPFALSDPDRHRDLLTGAGFTGVTVERIETKVWLAADLADAVGFFHASAPPALTGIPPATRAAVDRSLRAALAPYQSADGIRLPAAAWLVQATTPEAGVS